MIMMSYEIHLWWPSSNPYSANNSVGPGKVDSIRDVWSHDALLLWEDKPANYEYINRLLTYLLSLIIVFWSVVMWYLWYQ